MQRIPHKTGSIRSLLALFLTLAVGMTMISCKSLGGGSKQTADLKGNILTEYWMDMDTMKPSKYISGRGPVKVGANGKVDPNNLVKEGEWQQFYNASIVYGKTTTQKVGPLQGKGRFANGKREGLWEFYALAPKNKKQPQLGFFDPGPVQSSGNFQSERREGVWKTFHLNGTTASVKSYVNNKIQGEATSYFENGVVQNRQTYKNSILDGPSTSFFSNGKTKETANYTNGEINGLQVKYHKNGKTAARGEVRMGKKEGQWSFFHENGQLMQQGSFKIMTVYNQKEKKNEERGVMHGPWTEYYESGRMQATGMYDKNKKTGLWTFYNERGVKVADYAIKGIMVAGVSKIYDTTGRFIIGQGEMMGMPFKAKRNGTWKDIDPSGKVIAEGRYMMDKKNGAWVFYYPNGKIKGRGEYMMNKKNGMWIDYDAGGRETKRERWMMDKPAKF